jgi:hypothetical protein
LHEEKLPLSSRHSKVAAVSVSEKTKVALVEADGSEGPESMDVMGGETVSTVHVYDAGVLWFPTASAATTLNVCDPLASPV